jgi:hypothetical protein
MVAVARGTEAGFAPRFRPEGVWHKSYPPAPASWVHSELEWATWWVLTTKLKYRRYLDFGYQQAIPAAGLNKVAPDFRSDFWLYPWGRNGNPAGYRYPKGIVLDPLSFFTHKSKAHDILKRTVLATSGFLCVFIDQGDLERRAEEVVRWAARGVDQSSRRSF